MSILIKGMKMPKNCSDCPLAKYICFSTKQYVPLWEMARKRQEDCPIEDVPTPHGRLIDADAIFYQWYQLNFDRKITDGTLAYWNLLLKDAPTIIEAEGE